MTNNAKKLDRPAVGTEVGAHRWPHEAAHPDAWGLPWKGTVLAINDRRAWQGTMAFPDRLPSQDEVEAHIAPHTFKDRIPVLWDFGPRHGLTSMWERLGSVVPYAEDLAAWEAHRARTIELLRVRRAE